MTLKKNEPKKKIGETIDLSVGFDPERFNIITYTNAPFTSPYQNQQFVGNILNNIPILDDKVKVETKEISFDHFYDNTDAAITCGSANQQCCKNVAYQNDFKYTLCMEQKPLGNVSGFEIFLIIILLLLLIKVCFSK